jgi:hypothetical protein
MGRSSKANGRAPAPSRSRVRARWHPSGPAGRRRPPADLARDAERDSRRGPLHVLGMSAIPGSALSRGPPPHLRHTARSPPGAPAGDHHTPLAGRAAPHSLSPAIVSSLSRTRCSRVAPTVSRLASRHALRPHCSRLASPHAPRPQCTHAPSPRSLSRLQARAVAALLPTLASLPSELAKMYP